MRIHHDSLIFSATDLVNFLGCRHASFLDRRNIDEPALVAEDDPYLVLLQEKGIEHERRYLDTLRREGRDIVDIAAEGSLEDRVTRTKEAMAARPLTLLQPTLIRTNSERWKGKLCRPRASVCTESGSVIGLER